jgi:hypothetical protein
VFCILPSLGEKRKRPHEGAFFFSGGERGKYLISKEIRGLPEFVLRLELGKSDG